VNVWFNAYASVSEAFVHKDDTMCAEFGDFVQLLDENTKMLVCKEEGTLFNFCSYKKKGYESPKWCGNETRPRAELIKRCKNNVDKIYCLMLDVDGTMDILTAMQDFNEYEYLLYTTFNHSAARDKFRIVLPLEQPLTAADFNARHEALRKLFKVDGASFTISQAFYFPSYNKNNAADRIFYWHRSAVRFDAEAVVAVAALKHKGTAVDRMALNPLIRIVDINADLVYQAVMSCKGMHYTDALPLATLMKSKGLSYQHYSTAVDRIAVADSVLRTDTVSVQKLWEKGYGRVTHKHATELLKRLSCTKMPWWVSAD
jgi:hypothetical protein